MTCKEKKKRGKKSQILHPLAWLAQDDSWWAQQLFVGSLDLRKREEKANYCGSDLLDACARRLKFCPDFRPTGRGASKGVSALKNWGLNTVPGFLREVAIQIGVDKGRPLTPEKVQHNRYNQQML